MMRRAALALFAAALLGASAVRAADAVLPLNVLFVGSSKARTAEFERFLGQHFRKATAVDRADFRPEAAKGADVVLLDWNQSDSKLDATPNPLGQLRDWSKPTVLLNHAGLLVAGHWELIGGAG
jgi:hypothetical protein